MHLYCFFNISANVFDICGSVHHHLINKTTNVMQLGAIVFIIPRKTLYLFRVLFTPIIRSVLKFYMQLLVQSCIGMESDPVCYKMIRSLEPTAVRCRLLIILYPTGSDTIPIHDCTNNCVYSFKTLLMMGVKSTRNM
jgi:hypothetical protein